MPGLDADASALPPQVREAIAEAARVCVQLQASGYELSFHVDEDAARMRIEVHDLQGRLLFTVPPSKALQIATDGLVAPNGDITQVALNPDDQGTEYDFAELFAGS